MTKIFWSRAKYLFRKPDFFLFDFSRFFSLSTNFRFFFKLCFLRFSKKKLAKMYLLAKFSMIHWKQFYYLEWIHWQRIVPLYKFYCDPNSVTVLNQLILSWTQNWTIHENIHYIFKQYCCNTNIYCTTNALDAPRNRENMRKSDKMRDDEIRMIWK